MSWLLLLWLQAPATLPDLFWIILTTVLGLLLALLGLLGKVLWGIIDDRLKRLERWQEDHEP